MAVAADWREFAARVVAAERDALSALRLDDNFRRAAEALLSARGKIACMGVGKSGHIARKISATFASTGAPSFFIHPAEAGHGDLGMIAGGDSVLAFSYSGESDETLALLPFLRNLEVPVVAVCGRMESSLARGADIALSAAVDREACPLNLAPTASAAAAMALGHALAMTLMRARGFTPEDFARTHPAGALGRRLVLRVRDVMRVGEAVPTVGEGARLAEALVEMSAKRMGMTLIASEGALLGIFTDGDLRRALAASPDLSTALVADFMTRAPSCSHPDRLAAEAAEMMKRESVTQLPVLEQGRVAGALSIHDLLRSRVI